jgi:putative heme-binding domain-containing protein
LVGNIRSQEVWEILATLAAKTDLEEDRDYPAVLWSGMKEHVARQRSKALELLSKPGTKSIDRWIARRLASDWQHDQSLRQGIADWLGSANRSKERAYAVLQGMLEALQGRRRVEMPEGWRHADAQLRRDASPEIQSTLDRLGLLMADGVAEGQLMDLLGDSNVPISQRREAIRSLSEARSSGLRERLKPLLTDRDLGRDAIVALGMTGQNEVWDDLLEVFPRLQTPGRRAAIETFAANRDGMIRLVDAIEKGSVARGEVPAATLRQLHWSGDQALQGRLEALWPGMQWLTEEGRQRMAALDNELTELSVAEGRATLGRALWNKHCASCHKLFGEGGAIGPELTGAQRGNIRYWIENIADPSTSVADRFRVSLFLLRDGRIVTGVPLQEDSQVILVQTPTEQTRILKEDLEERRASAKSLMPDGLMDLMTAEERRDLMKYLMSPIQVTAAP